jgi:hypothetical protein
MNEVWDNERSLTYLQVLFQSLFFLKELFNVAVVRNIGFMLGQTLHAILREAFVN